MADRTENSTINIYINNAQAQQALQEYASAYSKARAEQKKMEVGTDQWIAKQKEINQISKSMAEYRKSIDLSAMSINQLQRHSQQLTQVLRNIPQGTNEFREMAMEVNRVNQRLDQVNQSFRRGQGDQQSYFDKFKNGIAALGVMEFGRQSLETASQMGSINRSLEFITGSSQGAAQSMEWLSSLTKKYGLELTSTANAYKLFAGAATMSGLSIRQSQKIFEQVTKAVVNMGLSAQDAEGVFLALSQMMSKGKVSAEELNGQLGERLPGAAALAAKALGVTQAELSGMLQKGEVITTDFLPKFADAMEKYMGEGSEKAATQMQGSLNRMQNMWTRFSNFFGSTVGMVLVDFVETTFNEFSYFGEKIGNIFTSGKMDKFGAEWARNVRPIYDELTRINVQADRAKTLEEYTIILQRLVNLFNKTTDKEAAAAIEAAMDDILKKSEALKKTTAPDPNAPTSYDVMKDKVKALREEMQNLLASGKKVPETMAKEYRRLVAQLDDIDGFFGKSNKAKKQPTTSDRENEIYGEAYKRILKMRQDQSDSFLDADQRELISIQNKWQDAIDFTTEAIRKISESKNIDAELAKSQTKELRDALILIYDGLQKDINAKLKEQLAKRNEIEARAAEERIEAALAESQKIKENREQANYDLMSDMQKQIADLTRYYDQEKALKGLTNQQIVDLERKKQQEIANIQIEAIKEQERLQMEMFEQGIQSYDKYFSYVGQIMTSLNEKQNIEDQNALNAFLSKTEKEKVAWDKKLKNKEVSQKVYDQKMLELDERIRKKKHLAAVEEFEREKDMQLTFLWLQAAAKALEVTIKDWPYGLIEAGLILGVAATQTAAIEAKEPPAYGMGGYFLNQGEYHSGPNGGMPVVDPNTGNVVAKVEKDEAIISRESTAANYEAIDWIIRNPGKSLTSHISATRIPSFRPSSASENIKKYDNGGYFASKVTSTLSENQSQMGNRLEGLEKEMHLVRKAIENKEFVFSLYDLERNKSIKQTIVDINRAN